MRDFYPSLSRNEKCRFHEKKGCKMKKVVAAMLLSFLALVGYTMELAEQFECMKRESAALESGDYKTARYYCERQIKDPVWAEPEVNTASKYVMLGLLCWCLHEDNEAKRALSRAINILRNGPDLGNGCEARTVVLQRKLYKLPRRLSAKEINKIAVFTMDVARNHWRKKTNQKMAHIQAMTNALDSQTRSLQRQGEFQASVSKFYAQQEYEKRTGDSFNPNYPPSNSANRDEWNACKRIYDIWGN